MKKLPLLPHVYQKIGLWLVGPFLVLGILNLSLNVTIPWLHWPFSSAHNSIDFSDYNLTDEFAAVGVILSMMLIAFSKEKTEDEAMQFFRLASLQWAVILNYLVLIVCIFSFYGMAFFSVMVYNMFTTLFLFIIRFRFVLYQHNKMAA